LDIKTLNIIDARCNHEVYREPLCSSHWKIRWHFVSGILHKLYTRTSPFVCPCNPAHIQNHFLHNVGLVTTGCIRRPVIKLLEHLKFWRNFGTKCGTPGNFSFPLLFYRALFISVVIIILFLSSSLISSHLTQAP